MPPSGDPLMETFSHDFGTCFMSRDEAKKFFTPVLESSTVILMPGEQRPSWWLYKDYRTVPKLPKLKTAIYRLHKENGHFPVTAEEFQVVKV